MISITPYGQTGPYAGWNASATPATTSTPTT